MYIGCLHKQVIALKHIQGRLRYMRGPSSAAKVSSFLKSSVHDNLEFLEDFLILRRQLKRNLELKNVNAVMPVSIKNFRK